MAYTLNAKIKFVHRTNDWATHQPVLYEMAMRTTGPIIEFGAGDNSTVILHEICKKQKRILVTVDDNAGWLSKFATRYINDGFKPDNSGWHKFVFVPGRVGDEDPSHWIHFLDTSELLKTINFELCFVDQAPWRGRSETVLRLKDKVKYIILHDCDYFAHGLLGKMIKPYTVRGVCPILDFSDTFKYFKVFFPLNPWPGESGPPTLLGSNFDPDLPDIDYNKY
jgi:hypothetical protein